MQRLHPLDSFSQDSFDDIQFHTDDSKTFKPTGRKKTTRLSNYPINIFGNVSTLLLSKRACILGLPVFILGCLLACTLEVLIPSERYNVIILFGLLFALEFPGFSSRSIRPQLMIVLIVAISSVMDIIRVVRSDTQNHVYAIWMLLSVKSICTCFVLYNMQGASRIRKYLSRRLRLFIVPRSQPKRIMRDVRGRCLAIGWIELFAVIAYATLFVVLLLYFDYSANYLSPKNSSYSLHFFLLVKCVLSFMVFWGVMYDTDIILCLWYFGCLGMWTSYVRRYINKKREDLGGWPLAFSFYSLRFHILSFVKVVDVMWGFYGWVLLGYTFGDTFKNIETKLRLFYGSIIFCLVITDVHCPTLFFGIRWLLRRRKVLRDIDMLEVSDDSELDEFNMRHSTARPISGGVVAMAGPKEEQTRMASIQHSSIDDEFYLHSSRVLGVGGYNGDDGRRHVGTKDRSPGSAIEKWSYDDDGAVSPPSAIGEMKGQSGRTTTTTTTAKGPRASIQATDDENSNRWYGGSILLRKHSSTARTGGGNVLGITPVNGDIQMDESDTAILAASMMTQRKSKPRRIDEYDVCVDEQHLVGGGGDDDHDIDELFRQRPWS